MSKHKKIMLDVEKILMQLGIDKKKLSAILEQDIPTLL